jgi:hypothetical protein
MAATADRLKVAAMPGGIGKEAAPRLLMALCAWCACVVCWGAAAAAGRGAGVLLAIDGLVHVLRVRIPERKAVAIGKAAVHTFCQQCGRQHAEHAN